MLTCHEVAQYFLSLTDEDAGDLISNLKLQKLVYYAQGFHLAMYSKPLFKEKIEAWTHGPVIPELYAIYKKYGSQAISQPTDIDFTIYDEQVRELLDEVYQVYGQFSAWKLQNLTHEEYPWKMAIAHNQVITIDPMETFFKTQLVDSEAA